MANDKDSIPKNADHIGPGAYLHPEKLCPYTLMLVTLWRHGWHILEGKYRWITPILSHISKTPNASILAPYGQNLVTNNLTADNGLDEIEERLSSQMEGHLPQDLPHTPLLQDSTLGMQELEDAAAEVQWRTDLCEGQDTFSNVVQIGGITMN
jgi:hypothetical protein